MRRALFVLAALLAALACQTVALEGSTDATIKEIIYPMLDEPFGFLPGGRVHLSMSWSPSVPLMRFLLCSSTDIASLNTNFNSAVALCEAIETVSCVANVPIANGTYDASFTVGRKDVYYLLLSNCDMETLHVKYTYELLNPGGQQLPYGKIPLPRAFMVLSVGWLLVLAVWAANALRFAAVRITLHRTLGVFGLLKTAAALSSAWYWAAASREASLPTAQVTGVRLLSVAARATGVALLMLSAHGLSITCVRLDAHSTRVVVTTVITLVAALVGAAFGAGYFFFLVAVIYVLVFRHLFGAMTGTLRVLHVQLSTVAAGGILPSSSPIARKVELIERVQMTVIAWIFCVVSVNVVGMFDWYDLWWLGTAGTDAADLGLFATLGVLLRLRDFSAYEPSPPRKRGADASALQHGRGCVATGSGAHDDTEYSAVLLAARNVDVTAALRDIEARGSAVVWQPGMALPNTPGFSLVSPIERPRMALIVQPVMQFAPGTNAGADAVRAQREASFALGEAIRL